MVQIEQILKECRQYNKFAQKMLYDRYASQMRGLCLRYIGDTELVKDIVQDGFIKVFSNIRQFDGKGSFEGWIKRIFINTAISYIRKHSKKNKHLNVDTIAESDILDTNTQYSENQSDTKNGKVDLIKAADLSEEELLDALQKIPENYRFVFNLFCIEGLKHEEIAEILEIDVTTSRTRLLRARGLIQKELYEICLKKIKQ